MRKLVKGITLTGVVVSIAVLVGLAMVRWGSCSTAAWVVKLVPDSKFGDRVDIAQQLMGLHKRSCRPDIRATVLRYCHDEPSAAPGYFEDAMSVDVWIDSHGLEVDSLTLSLDPGVTAGVFMPPKVDGSSDPLAYCPAGGPPACPICGRHAYGPYSEVLDKMRTPLKREDSIASDANTGRWTAQFGLLHALPGSSPNTLPIHYYALVARSPEPGMTCAKRSSATTLDYRADLEILSSSKKSGPLVHANEQIPVKTTVVSWSGLLSDPERAKDFGDKRFTARSQILTYKHCLDAHNDKTDLSGYRYWPENFPDDKATYAGTPMDFCQPPTCQVLN